MLITKSFFLFSSLSHFVVLVIIFLELDRKTKKFKLERHFVKRKHREGIYLVCELRSA